MPAASLHGGKREPRDAGRKAVQRNDEVQRDHQRQRVAAPKALGHGHEMPTRPLAGHEREGGGHDESTQSKSARSMRNPCWLLSL